MMDHVIEQQRRAAEAYKTFLLYSRSGPDYQIRTLLWQAISAEAYREARRMMGVE